MRKIFWVRAAILFVTIATLSGCLWVPVDEGHRHGGYEGDHGEHHGEHHEDRHDERR